MSNGFDASTTAEQATAGVDLSGKTVLVTGVNSGIGYETARALALRGAHVIGAARTMDKARGALQSLHIDGTPLACELSDLDSVRAAVATVNELGRPLHAIIGNAGVMALQEPLQSYGIERQLFTNHVGHFVLVTGVLDRLAKDGRVVMVSSGAHFLAPEVGIEFDNLDGTRDYDPWKMYGQSKLANILFVRSLTKRFAGTRRTANAVHPGVIATNLQRHLPDPDAVMSPFRDRMKTAAQGAATQCYVATAPSVKAISGQYFSDCNLAKMKAIALDDDLAERLWVRTEQIVAGIA